MKRWAFYGLLTVGIAFRVAMLLHYGLVNGGDLDVYLADEGVVGLMGRHILEGRGFPIFFYGQAYLGALEAYCVAASFALFGVGTFALRLVPLVFSLVLLAVVYNFAYRRYSVAAARWATAVLAVAPVYFLQWSLKARGGFIEHVVLLFLVMAVFWRFYLDHDRSPGTSFRLGLIAGFALWVNQLMLAYLAGLAALVAYDSVDRRGWRQVVMGFVLGAALLIGYNAVHPLATARAVIARAAALNTTRIEGRGDPSRGYGAANRISPSSGVGSKLGMVFGVPPKQSAERLGPTAAARRGGGRLAAVRRALWFVPAIVFGIALLACRPRRGATGIEPVGSNQLLALLWLVTVVVGAVSPRYMLPAYPLAAVMTGVLVSRVVGGRRRLAVAGIASVMAFNLCGWADAAQLIASRDDHRGEELLTALEDRGLDCCYSAGPLYHLVFASGERVILAPLRGDRYPAYQRAVEVAPSICYVFRDNQDDENEHRAFVDLLTSRSIGFKRERVGGYWLLSEFSPRKALSRAAMERVREGKTADDFPDGQARDGGARTEFVGAG